MKDISKLCFEIKSKIDKNVIPKLVEAQRNTAKKVWEDTISSAPFVRGDYIASIKLGDTTINKKSIKTQVYSDLKVGGSIPKWQNVPLANFVNWGTDL